MKIPHYLPAAVVWIGSRPPNLTAREEIFRARQPAPPFLSTAGDDRQLSSRDPAGKIVTLFYESSLSLFPSPLLR
ncbi:MAG TPA: hypothetical protein PK175_04110 [Syntrophales bacterium]|nr:hypothetical protein [Syntrophales bacterium]HQG34040.1 hypothetical protein [Syntrophales bacterium]HRU88421.1 hypothetical protein [Syntrophales bacterium]